MAPQPIPEPPPASQLEVVNAIDRLHESIREIAPPAKAQSAGESYLTVPISQALPKPPDVAVEAKVPGGVLLPCIEAGATMVNRNEFLLQFPFPQGFRLELTRIHLNIPVWLGELELEKSTTTETVFKLYKTEAEAKEFVEGKEGLETTAEQVTPIGFESRFERILNTVSEIAQVEGILREVRIKRSHKVERSVLPITIQVVARLKGPDGELWSGGFEVPMHFVEGTAGSSAIGTGLLDAYADLQNSITLNNQRVYSLQLLILVPTSVISNTQLGLEQKAKAAVGGKGAATIFYQVDPARVGK